MVLIMIAIAITTSFTTLCILIVHTTIHMADAIIAITMDFSLGVVQSVQRIFILQILR